MCWAIKVIKVPFTFNYDETDSEDVNAMGFAWSQGYANNMRGDDALRDEIDQLQDRVKALSGSRSGRRIMNRAAKRAAGAKK